MKYYTIKNQSESESAEILLYGEIGEGLFTDGIGAKQFAEELKVLKVKDITLRINSTGGSVFEGLAIYNTLERYPAYITVYVDGIAASIASVIAMAGDKVIMPDNALMMIHDPFAMVIGDSEDMRKMADSLDKVKEGLVSAYMKKTKMPADDISDLMSEETWMTAREAVEWGFADEISESVKMAASFNFSRFKNTPKFLLGDGRQSNARTGEVKPENNNQFKGGEKMDKCKVCNNVLTEGQCPACEAKIAEQARVKEILSIGEQFDMSPEAIKAVQANTTVEEFRSSVMNKLKEKITPIEKLPPAGTLARDMSTGPFKTLGEQLIAVYNAGRPGGFIDPKLQILNATGLGAAIPSEGGFLVQKEFSTALLDKAIEEAVLYPRCWRVPIGPDADGIEFPMIEETSRATGSRWGGVQVYRREESDTVTARRPRFASLELRLEDMMGLCYATNRLLKDAPSAEAIITKAFASEFAFRCDDEIINGTGVGQMLGILRSPALVTVSKEGGQAAATIVYANILKMYSRMPAKNRVRAAWYYNQEIEPQLFSLGITLGTGGAPVWLPPGGISGEPYSTLFGRPMIPIEQAAQLGTVGDIIFADLNEYLIIEKGGLDAQSSIHVRFIHDEMTFKFILRNNGAPVWRTTLTPYRGANALSPYVVLETRS